MSSNPTEPRREYPSTYFVRDRSNQDEMTRLAVQDALITSGMGGPLPEQPGATDFKRILDVACGTGGWLIQAAQTYPNLTRLVGIDANSHIVDYARAQAQAAQVAERVEFQAMDALLILEFPKGYFDLVNMRFATSFMRTWNWPKMLSEMQRVARPGGVVRLTEIERMESNSPSLNTLTDLAGEAFHNSGHLFTQGAHGAANELERLLDQYGLHDIQTRASLLEFAAGTPAGRDYAENMRLAYRTIVPFLRKWGHMPENYETLYQHMLDETQRPDFTASWKLITAWGTTTV